MKKTPFTSLLEAECRELGALWQYPGRGGHVILHAGNHSNFFFDCGKVVSNPILLDRLCSTLANELVHSGDLSCLEWVVGPAMGAIKIADGVARHLSHDLQKIVKATYTEKVDGGMAFLKADKPKRGDVCVVVEDTLTTGDSSNMCAQQILDIGAKVLRVRLTLVNRSGVDTLSTGEEIISVLSYSPNSWTPEECPLCQKGSEAIKEPKKQENWARLVSSGTH